MGKNILLLFLVVLLDLDVEKPLEEPPEMAVQHSQICLKL
jgi:hypothetical protein